MFNYIRVPVGLETELRTMRLVRKFGKEAILCVFRIWSFAAQYKPDGKFPNYSLEDIGLIGKCKEGDEESFAIALIDHDFIQSEDLGFSIKGWEDIRPIDF